MSAHVTELYQCNSDYSLNDSHLQHSYQRTFQVVFDSLGESGPQSACNAAASWAGCPFGSAWVRGGDSDLKTYVNHFHAECTTQEGLQYTVQVNYASYNPLQNTLNPLDAYPIIRWSFTQFEQIVDVDTDGKPIVNSAYDPFDPPVTRDQSRPTLTVQRNESKFSPKLAWSYTDTLNDSTFAGSDAGTVKVGSIDGEQSYDPNIGVYYIVTYIFHFDPRGWEKKILDAGLRQLQGGARVPIKEGNSNATSPVPLDGSGQPLPTPVTSDNVSVLKFNVYTQIDFSAAFNLDNYLS